MRRASAWVGAAVLCALAGVVPAAALPPTDIEVKAAFLYHFAQLVEWPPSAENGDLVVAVVGPDVFGGLLEEVMADKRVRNRRIRIERHASPRTLRRSPHVLFVTLPPQEWESLSAAIAGDPVLTISDMPGFAARGGIIGFRLTPDGRVTFDINSGRAQLLGLKMSSQLLKLARIVGNGA
jgi:hypothetical protein